MKKITALLLVLIMLVSVLTACGDTKDKDSEKTDETTAAAVEKDEGKDDGKSEDKDDEKKLEKAGVLPEKLTATKIASLDKDDINVYDNGLIYKDENGMYGTITLDGKIDSGAKWADCQRTGVHYEYFAVTTNPATTYEDIAAMNSYGIANAKGDLLIPEKYAAFDVLSERYVKVYEVTEKAEGKDDGLVYMSVGDEMFSSIFPDEDDVYLKGNWYVYDIEAGALVEGVSGTKPYSAFARGDKIEYYDDDYNNKCVDSNGKEWKHSFIDEDRGIYGIEDEDKGEVTVYTNSGKKLFTYDSEKYDMGFAAEELYEDYFKVSESKDGELIYYLMDDTGKIVSAGFEKIGSVNGECIEASGVGICDFEGNVIYATEEYISTSKDILYNALFSFKAGEEYVLMNSAGEIILKDNDISSGNRGVISKEIDDEYRVYCINDKEFSLKGDSFAPFLIQAYKSDYSSRDAIDVISGEILIEGYNYYNASDVVCFEDGTYGYYVYAEKEDGGYDVYEIK